MKTNLLPWNTLFRNKAFLLLSILSFSIYSTFSQETKEKPTLSLSADVVSRYLWRGLIYSPNVNIQPYASVSYKGFTISSWASYAIADKYAEIDFIFSYNYKNLTLLLSDYYNEDELNLAKVEHFNWNKDSTVHALEITASYKISDDMPLTLLGATYFYGNDRDSKGKNRYSTYFEVSYPFNFNDYSLNIFAGGTPKKGLYAEKAAIVHIGASVTKSIKITDSFNLPLTGTISSNPQAEDVFFILKVSF